MSVNTILSDTLTREKAYRDSVVKPDSEQLLIEADSIPENDTIILYLLEDPSTIEEKTDTIPSLNKHLEDSLTTEKDTIIDIEKPLKEQVVEQPVQQITVTPGPTRIHPDSLYTVKASPEHFEMADSIFETSEPAVNYFAEHHLEPQYLVKKIEKPESVDWAFPLFVGCLLFVAITKYFFYGRVKQMLSAALATRFFNQMEREGNFFNEQISYLLSANFLIVFSLLLFQTFDYFSVLKSFLLTNPLQIFSLTALALVLFFTIKYIVLNFLGWVFKSVSAAMAYYKNILIYNMLIGIAILPFVLINMYVPSNIFFYSSWGIFVIANLAKVTRGVFMGYNTAHFSGYYLILYLCGIELVPLLLFYKFSVNYFNTINAVNQELTMILNGLL